MVHKPQKDQENQITHQEFEPQSDLKKVRPSGLFPDDDGNVSLERKEKSLSPPKRKCSAKKAEKRKSR